MARKLPRWKSFGECGSTPVTPEMIRYAERPLLPPQPQVILVQRVDGVLCYLGTRVPFNG